MALSEIDGLAIRKKFCGSSSDLGALASPTVGDKEREELEMVVVERLRLEVVTVGGGSQVVRMVRNSIFNKC